MYGLHVCRLRTSCVVYADSATKNNMSTCVFVDGNGMTPQTVRLVPREVDTWVGLPLKYFRGRVAAKAVAFYLVVYGSSAHP